MTRRYLEMNPHDALYSAARSYPGGIEALARDLDVSTNVLRNKLAPHIKTHYVSFEEASNVIRLCQIAGVKEAILPLHALLARHDMAAFLVPDSTQFHDDDLSQVVCKVVSQVGGVAEAVSQALVDGAITEHEADLIEREFQAALSALGAWRARIRLRKDQK